MQTKSSQMSRALHTALLVLLLSAAGLGKSLAQTFTSGNLRYKVNNDGSSVTVIGHVDGQNATGTLIIPNNVNYNGRSYSVTFIGNSAFSGCTGFTGSLTIPNTVTSIGDKAFSNCFGFTGSLTISDAMTSIGDEAFSNCIGFTCSLTIPNSVTTIGSWAFSNCVGFTGSLTIPNSVTSIGGCAFSDCHFTGDLIIPNSVTSIGSYAFSDCRFAGDLIIPNSVTSIGSYAFSHCSCTGSLTIPNSVTSIGSYAFSHCGCTGNLTIPNSMTSIGSYAFSHCSCTGNLTIPNSVTSVSVGAFKNCDGLTSIIIPNSVNSIGTDAFNGCSRLTTVYYYAVNAHYQNKAAKANIYEDGVFLDCPNFTTLHIGPEVEEIDDWIFRKCTGVHLVVALDPTPATLVGGAFADFADNSILMVPCGNKFNYFSVWNMFDFNNILEDCGEYSIVLNNIGVGGSVSASTMQAQMGQEVQLTVTPNAEMMLSSISVCNATDPAQTIPVYPIGKADSKFGFIMPPFGVSVNATFTAGTSVEEYDNVPVSVYPNPTNNHVHIEAENLKHITISNMLGQTIFDVNANGNEFTYDFRKYNTGIYLIRIETASGMAVKKVSVTR